MTAFGYYHISCCSLNGYMLIKLRDKKKPSNKKTNKQTKNNSNNKPPLRQPQPGRQNYVQQ